MANLSCLFLQAIDTQLASLAPESIPASPHVGATVAATFSADGEVYRGRVVTLGSSGTATVLFIDFGNTEEKAAEELSEVPEHLLEERRPGLAERVEVAGGHLLPTTEEARQLLESRLDGEEVAMTRDQAGQAAFLVDGVRLEVEGLLGKLMSRSRVKEEEEEEVAQVELESEHQSTTRLTGWPSLADLSTALEPAAGVAKAAARPGAPSSTDSTGAEAARAGAARVERAFVAVKAAKEEATSIQDFAGISNSSVTDNLGKSSRQITPGVASSLGGSGSSAATMKTNAAIQSSSPRATVAGVSDGSSISSSPDASGSLKSPRAAAGPVAVKVEELQVLEEWGARCLRMLAGGEEWGLVRGGPDKKWGEIFTSTGARRMKEELRSGGEEGRRVVEWLLEVEDLVAVASSLAPSQVVQVALTCPSTAPGQAAALARRLAAHLPALATRRHGYLALLAALDTAAGRRGEFTAWLEVEAVLLRLLMSELGAVVAAKLLCSGVAAMAAVLRTVLPRVAELASLPTAVPFLLLLVEMEAGEGRRQVALELCSDSSLATLAHLPAAGTILAPLLRRQAGAPLLLAASWVARHLELVVTCRHASPLAAEVVDLLAMSAGEDQGSATTRCYLYIDITF